MQATVTKMKTRSNNFTILITVLFFAADGLISCSTKAQEVETKEVVTLRASQLYDGSSVTEFLHQHPGEYEEISKHYLSLASESREVNPSKAIYYYKRAISLSPTLERYTMLGEHLIVTKNFKEAHEVYDFIATQQKLNSDEKETSYGYVFGAPDEEMQFTAFKISLLADPGSSYYSINNYLGTHELEDKYKLKVKLLDDILFKNDTSSFAYKAILKSFSRLQHTEDQQTFSTLLTLIKDTSSSFEITTSSVANFNYISDYDSEENEVENNLNYYFKFLAENKNEEENTWHSLNYNRRVVLPRSVHAITYCIDTSANACPKEMRHIYHRLVTYDGSGIIIDSKVIAWQSGEEMATVTFKAPSFAITRTKRFWKNPYVKDDFDNYLLKTEDVETKSYSISPTGKIVESSSL